MTNKGDWKQIYLIITIFFNLPGKIKEANINFYFYTGTTKGQVKVIFFINNF